jgi:hypothetical protein
VLYLISFILCPSGIHALLPKKIEPLALMGNEACASTLSHSVSQFDIGKPEHVIGRRVVRTHDFTGAWK